MSGNLPPGVTDADIDRAAPGYDDPPFYCVIFEGHGRLHCADFGYPQCYACQQSAAANRVTATVASGRAPSMANVAHVLGGKEER